MGYISQYPPAHNDTYVKATETYNEHYYPYFATDPALSLTGNGEDAQWYPDTFSITNQRFHIDLGSSKIIVRLYYENSHVSGGGTIRGVKNFTLWGSNDPSAFADLVYSHDTNWTQLTTGQSTFDQHVGADQADPKYILVTNSTAYRYYAIKCVDNYGDSIFLGFRHIELQSSDSVEETDTLNLSDEIEASLSLEKTELLDTLNLNDEISISIHQEQYFSDILSLNDQIEVTDILSKHLNDTLTLSDSISLNIPQLNKKLSDTLSLSDVISSSLFTVSRTHFDNYFSMFEGITENLDNDVRTRGLNLYNLSNDIRFILPFQQAGDTGFQSLGKKYIKVYIDSIEQTDVDVDSITITQNLNSAHTTSFLLGRPYDTISKPAIDSSVEIKYHIWTLYKGYITEINPSDRPDLIKVNCQDEYWKRNRIKKYFNVGHQPSDDTELYYNYISFGLSACGASFGIGNFIPQTINLFGVGESDCISQLIENAGNYGWFYHVDKNSGIVSKKLQISGAGDVINLERQELETNLGLYQVLTHNIQESIVNIVNKYRVQMGDIVIRRFNRYGDTKEYSGYEYKYFTGNAIPDWTVEYEKLAENSDNGQDIFHHKVELNDLYKDVFCKYKLPNLDSDLEEWTDEFSPEVSVLIPFSLWWKCSLGESGKLTEGFTIDYENKTLTFSEPLYLYTTNEYNELSGLRRPQITLKLWKKKYYSRTEDPSDDPTSDISNPLMFFTSKLGSYSDTIMENLSLEGLGIQIGGKYQSGETESGKPIYTYVPSWNDTDFAQDYANWQLSKNCDKKYKGFIDLTIDAMCFYDINLDNRIMINNILDTNLNIESIVYNIGSWKATINLINGRKYLRSISIPLHGE